MDDGRHDGVGIELHVGRVELIAPPRHRLAVERNTLLGKREPPLIEQTEVGP